MPRSRPPYPTEYREQILSLHRAGRSVASLARDFEPSATTIYNWVAQEREQRSEGDLAELHDDERLELEELRKRVAQLETEREILEKAAVWFAQKTNPKFHSGS